MNRKNRFALIIPAFLAFSLLLTSCNLPAPTATPVELATPTAGTSTPEVVESPTAGTPDATAAAECDLAEYISDVTYPDNTSVDASETITKTWQVKNVGNCTWDSTYKLVFVRGEQMDGTSPAEIITDPVAPGGTVDLSVKLTAPTINGTHWGVWQVYNADGKPVLKADGKPQELSILIRVANGQGGKVTAIHDWSYTFTGTKCTNTVQYDVVASIYANGPVGMSYTWSVTSGALTVVTQNYVFSDAGSAEVTTSVVAPFTDPNNVTVTLTANDVSTSFTICP